MSHPVARLVSHQLTRKGVSLIVFILTFAVFGGAGPERPFPVSRLPNSMMNPSDVRYLTRFGYLLGLVGKQQRRKR